MKKILIAGAAFAVLSATALAACSSMDGGMSTPPATTSSSSSSASLTASNAAVYHNITPEEAKKRLDADSNVIVLDVRTPEEYKERHIEGAILVPNETIQNAPPMELPDLNAEIIVHCRTGVRSKQASDKLVAMGYTNIYDMGGINDWPYDTVSGEYVPSSSMPQS